MSSPEYSHKVVLVCSSNVSPHVGEETRGAWDPKSDVASELTPCQISNIIDKLANGGSGGDVNDIGWFYIVSLTRSFTSGILS